MRIALLALVTLTLACRSPELPVNTVLWRLDSAWTSPPNSGNARVAKATLISFRSGDEYIEHHCELIERAGSDAVYIVSRGERLVAVGRWVKDGAEVRARRQSVHRKPPAGGVDPACQTPELVFRLQKNSQAVTGETGDMRGVWTPVTRLVSPDYESYIDLARNSSTRCAVEEK